ncbi:290549a9-bae7-41a1-a6c5-a664988d13f5 [Thermothielavioides terrestris]|uniref:290549a9-bae7-41a1-a6c5-a664988d13f5 n=1 Tax=Thermothielavioides terrestris TaxID=2587410 RepID=A0A446BRJ7_9PEZI|nr:290549a9-bae7-41a1-a6c5-a664988d13f5 [Thermothielavioides terrestris]
MATRKLISSGSAFEAQIGYSRAVVVGDMVYDYKTGAIADDVAAQAEQCMRNIAAALAEAGAAVADVVRVRYILPDRRDFERTWPVLQKWFGEVRPAATMIQAGLMEEVMKIEIEVTAKKGGVADDRTTLL